VPEPIRSDFDGEVRGREAYPPGMDMAEWGRDAVERLYSGQLDAVIFEANGAYVQVAGERDIVRCEAAGDANLREPLTFEQLKTLSKLGFYPPDAESGGNHWQELRDRPAEKATQLCLHTLTEVYGAAPEDISLNEV
jgi:hypothetical protein